ncbi:MAG TPA: DUF1064 domain-containing protein [bacterium]|nr:DUF1064 domain-containing protein [bacterium]
MRSWRIPKYRNKRTSRGDQVFDSKREATDYDALAMLQRGGVIRDLQRQKTFRLVVNGKLVTTYRADFIYTRIASGKTVIHETKGFWTDAFRIKWKLLKALNGDEYEYVINGVVEK